MRSTSEDDDFFGIEYSPITEAHSNCEQWQLFSGLNLVLFLHNSIVVTTIQVAAKAYKDFPEILHIKDSSEGHIHHRKTEDRDSTTSDISGTDFLDNAFFPEVVQNVIETSDGGSDSLNRISPNLFENQYFRYANQGQDKWDGIAVRANNDFPTIFKQMQMFFLISRFFIDRQSVVKDDVYKQEKPNSETINKQLRAKRLKSKPFNARDKEYEEHVIRRESQRGSHSIVMDNEVSTGLDEIFSSFVRLSNFDDHDLIDYIVQSVVYKDENLVAFNKPFGMAYSGSSTSTPQFDRILQTIKFNNFLKMNSLLQSELRNAAELGKIDHVYRCIVRGRLKDSPINITIPLLKTLKNRDMKVIYRIFFKDTSDLYFIFVVNKTPYILWYLFYRTIQNRKYYLWNRRVTLLWVMNMYPVWKSLQSGIYRIKLLREHKSDHLCADAIASYYVYIWIYTYTCSYAKTFRMDVKEAETT
uniref:Ion_trans domain-containing protein n=1 Tax=Heterorhabditis bacteriophora TaxID=37862 RepID=A0A1I7WPA2_HETBA